MSAEEWGDFTGQVIFEIGMEVATVGGASTLTAVKAADKTIDAVKVLDKLDDLGDIAKAGDKIDDASDAMKTLDRIDDISDGNKLLKAPEELGEVVHIPKKKPSFKHGQSEGGPGTWQKETTPRKGAEYQKKVTGAPKDTEHVVETDLMKSGKKKFDGYDPETNTLTDASDWDGWPPESQKNRQNER